MVKISIDSWIFLLFILFQTQVSNLREIQALKRLTPHPNIINLEEVLYDEPSGRLAMVFELMEQNLYDMISGESYFTPFPPVLPSIHPSHAKSHQHFLNSIFNRSKRSPRSRINTENSISNIHSNTTYAL